MMMSYYQPADTNSYYVILTDD